MALGGNALLNKGDRPTFDVQMGNVESAVRSMAGVLSWDDMQFVMTHGNGPQVGSEVLRNEAASAAVPKLPLHILSGETQALIGSMLERAISQEFRARGVRKRICTIVTHTLVEKDDPAFGRPTKPIGPFYSKPQLDAALKAEKFSHVKVDGGYRRVVASPKPIGIVEADAILRLLDEGYSVICCGGGGIPVCEDRGRYLPMDSVIDKDLATQVAANALGARKMVILTAIERVYRDYANRKGPIASISCSRLRPMMAGFEEGSIRPKLEACARFVENGGRMSKIGHLTKLQDVLAGRSGTTVTIG